MDMENMPQNWFEMPEIKARFYDRAVWIPLRQASTLIDEGSSGYLGYREEYFGVGSILVPISEKSQAEKLEWADIGLRGTHKGYVNGDTYTPAYVYRDFEGGLVAEHPVIVGEANSLECTNWILNPDISVTLDLKNEGDTWVCMSRGYEEVIKIRKNENGCIVAILMKASYLKDYLAARKMTLYITSYRSRVQVVSDRTHLTWADPHVITKDMDRWEGRIMEIHEGGHQYGSKFAVLHTSRTDVDFDEDIPEFGFASEESTTSESWEGGFDGKKLYRVEGELWRNEWVEPAAKSEIVAGEENEPTSFFITDNSGTTESRKTLDNGKSRWLWFSPSVIATVLNFRGSSLEWHTMNTGSIKTTGGFNTHFGINSIGLVNVYAKDIGLLPDWEQKIWAGHNIAPDGKVSTELLMSQMEAKPASTQAPEDFLALSVQDFNKLILEKYGVSVLRDHPDVDFLLRNTHRFKVMNEQNLFELAKNLTRLLIERLDVSVMRPLVVIGKDEKLGSMKLLERMLSTKIEPGIVHNLLTPLHVIYDLRLADAHLTSSEIAKNYAASGINTSDPFVMQGCQLIDYFVVGLAKIIREVSKI